MRLAYSAASFLDNTVVLAQLSRAGHRSGLFAEADIESRAETPHHLVGTADTASAYVQKMNQAVDAKATQLPA